MLFNPYSKKLFDNDGNLLKQLHCPQQMTASTLQSGPGGQLSCSSCAKPIIRTKGMTDGELKQVLRSDPSTCLLVSLDDPNIVMTHKA